MSSINVLKVSDEILIKKIRILPISGEVLVKKGDFVTNGTVVAKTLLPGEIVICDVANRLGFFPDPGEELPKRIFKKYYLKKEGDDIQKDEVIANYTTLFGLIKNIYKSPVEGTIESVSNLTGNVAIRQKPIPVYIDSYIPGIVAEVISNQGVIVETIGAFIQGIIGIGGETHGKIEVVVDSPEDIVTDEHIKIEHKGKILVGGSLVTVDALRKAIAVGIKGIITGGIESNVLEGLLGHRIGVAITGMEELGITLIITEGFGKINMMERVFNILKSFNGMEACINGTTQIRAGVIRPEVIIPLLGSNDNKRNDVLIEDKYSDTCTIGIGTRVRIIRAPDFGVLGRISNIISDKMRIDTESKVRIFEIELDDGRIILLPRANVEIIE